MDIIIFYLCTHKVESHKRINKMEITERIETRKDVKAISVVCIAAPIVGKMQPTADVNIITVYGGRYLVYHYQGPYEKLGEVNAKVYGELLPLSGEKFKIGDGIIEHCQMFERYLNDPETTQPKDLVTEIWIPIE